ncbi:hypothetical protein [Legionella clemsonensis]|uniref:Uncharacterized protein n=1 Tax=Legionella clemsonensis TaxID=1867846 RepID=A0A222P1G3_9GAMM|nr:hypothetical protein [Legionella clemsonensis]ASQ45676.1 hypothetical protein clem_05600 [Legionella clemsonensis]
MLKLLLPDNINLIIPEFYLDIPSNSSSEEIKAALKSPSIRLDEKSLSLLDQLPDIQQLTQFVMVENSLFDLNNITRFKFVHHQALFKVLQKKPTLRNSISTIDHYKRFVIT